MKKFFADLLKGKKKPDYSLDIDTKHMLLAATGCLGGDLCDLLLKHTKQDEQKFVTSIETGLFSIGVISYYFTFYYRKDIPPLLLALELSEMYKNHFSGLNGESQNSDNPIEKYFFSEGKTTLSTTIGAIQSEELNSQKLYWTLSRVLYQRIRISCANNFNSHFQMSATEIDEIESKVKNGINACLHSFEHFMDNSETFKKADPHKSSEPEVGRAICIKCGNFKAAALGRCSSCNFAPETSLDAAKSVILRIENFPWETLLNISRDIKEKGISGVSFAGAPLKDFIDAVEDVKKGKNTRAILEMNKHETDRQDPALTQTILGWRYHQGEGVAQDYSKAAEFWKKASDLGNTEAHYNLSKLYAQGDGVSQDPQKAGALLTLAAEQGHSDAQEVLGLLHLSGNGVERDQTKGIAWLTKAAQNGSNEAKNLLKELHALDSEENNTMKPDYGLHLIKKGLEKETEHYIYGFKIDHLNRLDNNTLTTVANTVSDGETYAVSFDIPAHLFNDLLEQISEPTRTDVKSWLHDEEEWCYEFDTPQSLKVVKTTLGELQTSAIGSKEKFVPLIVQSFGLKTDAAFEVGNRVFHGKFGYGKIINIDGHKLQINFDQVGSKQIMDNFVELASE